MIKSKYDILLERLNQEGKVSVFDESTNTSIITKIEEELDEYRFENQKRIRESQEEIATVILTA